MRAIITFEWSRVLATSSSPRMTKGKVALVADEGKDEVESSQLRERRTEDDDEQRMRTEIHSNFRFVPHGCHGTDLNRPMDVASLPGGEF